MKWATALKDVLIGTHDKTKNQGGFDRKKLGEGIKAIRIAAGMYLDDFSVSRSCIRRAEQGEVSKEDLCVIFRDILDEYE